MATLAVWAHRFVQLAVIVSPITVVALAAAGTGGKQIVIHERQFFRAWRDCLL